MLPPSRQRGSQEPGGPPSSDERAADEPQLQLSRLLGSGRHGMVFLAVQHDGSNRTSVAVKVPSHPTGLVNEQLALQRFAHQHIIKVLGGPLSNGSLVLEYCDRGTLAHTLQEETLSPRELGSLLGPLVEAVAEIHRQGWIHGDISPSNIGLRSSGGPALLDFATARPSDGSTVDEGTAEFAGPLRQADPRLDTRSLTATALRALGEPDRWDHKKRVVHEDLTGLLSRCDADEPVELQDLGHIVSTMCDTFSAGFAHCDLLGGGSDVTPTRAFGPRPTGDEASAAQQQPSSSRRLVGFAAAIILTIAAVAIEFVGVQIPQPLRFSEDVAASLRVELTAEETLEDSSASWNSSDAVITLHDTKQGPAHFAAGRSGDVAAIADWSCDGTETLGIFRPSTGNWFEFDSWNASAPASPRRLAGGSTLWVTMDGNGCATAILR